MMVQSKEQLKQTIVLYAMLSSLFLTLPDETLVKSIVSKELEEGTGSKAFDEIARYGQEQQNRNSTDVLLDLARDRVRLMRGVNQEGIEPPYESLYLGQQANASIGSLNVFYQEMGYTLADDVKDAPDQLGVEIAFDKLILEHELKFLDQGDYEKAVEYEALHQRFLNQHLGSWASNYAAKMEQAAQTGFYRGVALLIIELLP